MFKKFVVVMLTLIIMLTSAAAEEIRTIFVVGFDFRTAEVILEDEDGFLWLCPFGENSWAIGEEYQLVIDGENIAIETCEEE
jgi:hypothetical protein